MLASIFIYGYNINIQNTNVVLCKIYLYFAFLFSSVTPTILILASIDRLLISSQNVDTHLYSSKRLAYFSISINELVDFTIPFYLRSLSECIDMELFHRCSLKLIKVELVCLKSLIFHQYRNHEITHAHLAKSLTMLMQSGTELALKQSLQINGRSNQEIDEIIMQFWHLYEQTINNEVFENDINTYATYLILKKE
ncbi:unnamed protein product [Adineta steineri]|uniref:Uncharacterized protein n=1 Tax=Adineta steineri TaxID=433720 RepID=A0A814Z604_9BILA|nr:unnamed protein product [Adineta steineri]